MRTANHRPFVLTISLLCCLCLSACNRNVPVLNPAGVTDLSQLNHWKIKARIAIKTPEDTVSATLDWKKNDDNFDFHLYGLFGATYAHLVQSEHKASLTLAEDKVFFNSNAENLLSQRLGWNFPLDALSYWIKGLPSNMPGESISRSDNGNIAEAHFNNWNVFFSSYQNYSGYLMPKIIKATHPQLTIKLVINNWLFLPVH